MNRPEFEPMRDKQRRQDQVRRRHLEAVMRLAETEERMALTFESLAEGSRHPERRTALALEARTQAVRLRQYASRLERQQY
jgi:hypothetical protein